MVVAVMMVVGLLSALQQKQMHSPTPLSVQG